MNRLQQGKCTIELGLILEDLLTNMERVSDHCSNIALEMIAIHADGYDTHGYFKSLSPQERAVFDTEYQNLKIKYQLNPADDRMK